MKFSFRLVEVVSVLVLGSALLSGCAKPGDPPNLFNKIIGTADFVGGNVLINKWQIATNQAYLNHKITQAQFDSLNALAKQARQDIDNLAAARAANQSVTQAQIDTALNEFIQPASEFVATYFPDVTPVQPVSTRP